MNNFGESQDLLHLQFLVYRENMKKPRDAAEPLYKPLTFSVFALFYYNFYLGGIFHGEKIYTLSKLI